MNKAMGFIMGKFGIGAGLLCYNTVFLIGWFVWAMLRDSVPLNPFNTDTLVQDVGIGILCTIPLYAIQMGIFWLFTNFSSNQKHLNLEMLLGMRLMAKRYSIPTVLAALLFLCACEELLFRGAMYPELGLITSSILFTLAHSPGKRFGWMLSLFSMGIVWCLLYDQTGSLTAPIVMHFCMNSLSMLRARNISFETLRKRYGGNKQYEELLDQYEKLERGAEKRRLEEEEAERADELEHLEAVNLEMKALCDEKPELFRN
jgi:membrane protease YdiL (CAAX protease family)